MSRSSRIGSLVVAVLAVGTSLVAGATAASAKTAPVPLTISPAAGTPAASPQTQISILGAAPKSITSVKVVGATSGAHAGKLRPYSAGRGASFVPTTPLTVGEDVTATIRVKGCKPIVRKFTIATSGQKLGILNITVTQPALLDHYVTQPGLDSPKIAVTKTSSKVKGSVLLTPLPSPVVHPGATQTVTIAPVGPGGPMIVDKDGELVWFRKITPPDVAANLRLQQYQGKPVLTWWQGPVTTAAFGLGAAVISDTRYRTIATVNAGNGYKMDLHEFGLTNAGTAVFTIYSPILVHLDGTPPGALSPLMDSMVQEVDIKTGLVVWEWHAYGHVPLSQSHASPENSATYDAFHINSIQSVDRDRKVVVSMRDTAAIYQVDRSTGKIDWRLGGTASDFKMGKGTKFWLQHDALLLPGNRVSMFDDEAGPPQKAPSSRGLIVQLDHKRHTAKLVQELKRGTDTSAQSEGSTQSLPSGNVFVGFGSTGFFAEFTSAGTLLFDAHLPDGDGSYRNYRVPWSTTPTTRPDAAARTENGGVAVYASWNGATTVATWQVLSGASAYALTPATTAPRSGFETRIPVTTPAPFYAVRALDADGKTLSTSAAVQVPAG